MKALFKTIETIYSCETIKQLDSANNMVKNYSALRPDDCANELLHELVYKRFNKIGRSKEMITIDNDFRNDNDPREFMVKFIGLLVILFFLLVFSIYKL